jgi:hypothetical protein
MEPTGKNGNADVKLVALINKHIEIGVAMNALAHAVAACVNIIGDEGRKSLNFLNFVDADGEIYPSISARSFIVLRGRDVDIRNVRFRAAEAGIPVVCFTDTMTQDTYVEQLDRTKATPNDNLTFYGLVLVGPRETVDPITRKYSLWRS